MSHRGSGSGSGDDRRSSRLVKGKAVAYAPERSHDNDDEYDAMEDPCSSSLMLRVMMLLPRRSDPLLRLALWSAVVPGRLVHLAILLGCQQVLFLRGLRRRGGEPLGLLHLLVPLLRDFGFVCFRCYVGTIEVVVALYVGLECTRIPYFRLSCLID